MKKKLAIVIPVYKSSECINALYENILLYTKEINFRIIFVNDGSPDDSLIILSSLVENDKRVQVVNLSKNYGQHIAITAGMAQVTEDIVIVMDCDLQHHPKFIPELIKEINNGYDIVFTVKSKREFSKLRNIYANLYYLIVKILGDSNKLYEVNVGNYTCLSKKVVDAFLKYNEIHRHYLYIVKDLGFKKKYIEIKHYERYSGESSYDLVKLINHAVDGLIISSSKLLYASVFIGGIFIIICIILMIYFIYIYMTKNSQSGWLSTIIIITLFSGINMLGIGVMGIYIGKIYEQVKQRPMYIIENILSSNKG